MREITLYNSLAKEKQVFETIKEGFVGMYVCGPTVYSEVHLGNCRTFVSFDLIYRYLVHVGYKVRYVRNITDVGHLLDDGEDRMAKGAKLEQLEPMEVAQKYTNGFHHVLDMLNAKRPSIEPRATGHIIEQIEMVQNIIDNGYGYVANGSVYFDTIKYAEKTGKYGELSGRVIDDLLAETRDNLKNQSEKKHPSDFAIWMKAAPEHIMKWNSPWSEGFPGWHLECSAMSTKYLGERFDIHGGGNDLKFPHHENEIAQNVGACGCSPVNYWLHTNMLLMNGKKMSKSDGNTISPYELFSGDSPHISKGYAPTVVRFFMLQSHYRSTMDITDEALLAAEKGYKRLMDAYRLLSSMSSTNTGTQGDLDNELLDMVEAAYRDMDDDFNTPRAIAKLFEIVPTINSFASKKLDVNSITSETLDVLKDRIHSILFDIFGLEEDIKDDSASSAVTEGLMELILDIRQKARAEKNWDTADQIRDKMKELNITVKDGAEGTSWTVN